MESEPEIQANERLPETRRVTCPYCKKWLYEKDRGTDLEPVKISPTKWAHKDCHELAEWRKANPAQKRHKKGGKAGAAGINQGRVIRGSKSL